MLNRWDPFRELMSLRRMADQMLEESLTPGSRLQSFDWGLALDVLENPDEFVVKASLPGLHPDDVDITFSGNTLTIRGEIKSDETVEEGRYHLRERRTGKFARSITLPTQINSEAIDANFQDGELILHLPKAEEVKPMRIAIQGGETPKMIEGKFQKNNEKRK